MVRKHSKLKRIIIFAAVALIITAAVSSVAYAHSGKTDSSGGHYDHDTGEYHYHHGYPAHQHTDMDGDGDLDCPYDFEDSTDYSSRSSSSSAAVYPTAPPLITPTYRPISTPNTEKQVYSTPTPTKMSNAGVVIELIIFCLILLPLAVIYLYFIFIKPFRDANKEDKKSSVRSGEKTHEHLKTAVLIFLVLAVFTALIVGVSFLSKGGYISPVVTIVLSAVIIIAFCIILHRA